MTEQFTKLWAWRYSVAKGYHWQFERPCNLGNASEWLEVYKKDEPNVKFKISDKKPRIIN